MPHPRFISKLALAVCFCLIAASTVRANTLLTTGFESGIFVPPWYARWTTSCQGFGINPVITTDAPYVYAGTRGEKIFYYSQGAGHDCNAGVTYHYDSQGGFTTGITETSVRGYVYMKTPEAGSVEIGSAQRKLMYHHAVTDPNFSNMVLITDSFAGAGNISRIHYNDGVSTCYQDDTHGSGCLDCYGDSGSLCRLNSNYWTVAGTQAAVTLMPDTYYEIELYVKLNTAGNADGIIRYWINGVLMYEQTNARMRHAGATKGIGSIDIGDQLQVAATDTITEYRGWDDLAISDCASGDCPIGPDPTGPGAISLSASSVAFGGQGVNTTSAGSVITLTNTGGGLLTFTGIYAPTNFARTTTCGATLAAGANCTITVTFTPTEGVAYARNLTIISDAPTSPDVVALTGTGILRSMNAPGVFSTPRVIQP